MRIDKIPNRNSPPQYLLRRSWREGNRIRHETLANLTKLPMPVIEALRTLLKGGVVLERLSEAVTVKRTLPHGHVAAALATARQLQMPQILDRHRSRLSQLALAGIICRLIAPASRLATAAHLSAESATTSLGTQLELGSVTGNEMLNMLEWLQRRQPHIERALANRHLAEDSTLILYDVSSSYLEGRCCTLAQFGYSRDGRRNKRQIVYGLLCNADGCPIAIEVFEGNVSDPATVASQVNRVRQRFRIDKVALVGDRGMLTGARIREDLKPVELDWISALTSDDVKKLLRRHSKQKQPVVDPGALLPDQVAEVISPDFPGERLMVCMNPRRCQERRRKREKLLQRTEQELEKIARHGRQSKAGAANRDWMNSAIGARAKKWKMMKHFITEVREDGMHFARNPASIEAESRLDGIYVIRTSLGAGQITSDQAVEAYKSLSRVERAFRTVKTDRLQVRPIHVYRESRVRGHVFLCMLAYYLEWHMRRRLAPLLYEDDDRNAARAQRKSPVAPAEVSDRAKRKADTKRTAEGLPVLDMSTLMAHLGTLTLNEVSLPSQPSASFMLASEPTLIQSRAFELLGLSERDKVFTVN